MKDSLAAFLLGVGAALIVITVSPPPNETSSLVVAVIACLGAFMLEAQNRNQ